MPFLNLKLENILLDNKDNKDTVKLMDFGVPQFMDTNQDKS